jgi:tripartite-type tricarboxylate transporter receptor subunit TctC
MVGPSNAINATLYDKLNFNFIRGIAPVAGVISAPNVMVVNPSVPAKTVFEFIAYAKANPGKINMPSGGIGTAQHVAGELFKMMTGVDMVHVPYRRAGPRFSAGFRPRLFFYSGGFADGTESRSGSVEQPTTSGRACRS